MKILTIICIVLAFVFTSCEKENYNEPFLGWWYASESSITFEGYPLNKAGFSRLITDDTAYTENINEANLLEAKTIKVLYSCDKNFIYYEPYSMSTNEPSTGCPITRYDFYNIVGKLSGDTLIETGSYNVYINGEGVRSINSYTAKFVKRK